MKCPNCNHKIEKINVEVEGAESKVTSYQCPSCDYLEFEKESATKVIEEIKAKETPLKIKQKIVKISKGRLGMYFNRDVVRSLNLKSGKEVYVSVPDKKHIVLNLKG